MKCRKAYGIMPVGENDRSAHVAQQKAPEVATPGLFYLLLLLILVHIVYVLIRWYVKGCMRSRGYY